MARIVRYLSVAAFAVVAIYPIAGLLQHGLDPALWPSQVEAPARWFRAFAEFDSGWIGSRYWEIAIGRSDAFAGGGHSLATVIVFMPLALMIAYLPFGRPPAQQRDATGVFGDARFASSDELSRMTRGLELGRDPGTGAVVRVAVQGTLATIAPPRKGKTSGLLIPNLAYPEPQSWGGPAVVIDPKGEVYRSVAARRRALGRRVVCLDPLDLVGGKDRWNPLKDRDPSDVLYLQHTALALLPEASGDSEAAAYFRNRAVDLIVGAMIVALHYEKRSVAAVQMLLSNEEKLIGLLKKLGTIPAALSALEILEADPKTKDPVKSTALQAFQWIADQRLRRLVSDSTFDLADLSSGAIDLFVAVPPEHKRVLAPLLRWLLSDLFTSVRRNRPSQRIIIFIDEAAALGKFDEILTASGELPGYGASLWTMWQDRSQIVGLYGQAGADTILNTAEIVTIFDVPAVDPYEAERWSRAVGQYTARVESLTRPAEGAGSRTISSSSQAAPLMTKEALTAMPSTDLIVFPNSGSLLKHPMRLHKTMAHTDARFRKLIKSVKPVGQAL